MSSVPIPMGKNKNIKQKKLSRHKTVAPAKIKFQAEEPDTSPAKDLMRRFDAVGLPAYVILRPKAG